MVVFSYISVDKDLLMACICVESTFTLCEIIVNGL